MNAVMSAQASDGVSKVMRSANDINSLGIGAKDTATAAW
jgi:hypothetical protein